jgi:uncharacterized protein (DUF2126 family)
MILLSTTPYRTVAEIRAAVGTPRWTRAQVDDLLDRVAAGQPHRYIAEALGRSRGAIKDKLRALKVKGAIEGATSGASGQLP